MKTYSAKPSDIERKWYVVDADGLVLGRMAAVIATILAAVGLDLEDRGVNLVGAIPQGLPPFALPSTDLGLIGQLWVPALLISIIGFVESVSVAQTLAAKRRQRIAPTTRLSTTTGGTTGSR